MTRNRKWLRLSALLMVLGLVAAACGDDDDVTAPPDDEPTQGGELVFGVEQWPECINPITSCYAASWASWSVFSHVLPQAMTLDPDSNYLPSPVLAGEPEVSEGEPFSVTFNIAEEAVWDDGTPISSADFEFTWRTHIDTPGASVSTGYSVIESVDTSDPKVAVVTFTEVYAPWRDLFGGIDYILPAHLFDSTDVSAEMADNIPFSGHSWKLESWSDTEAVLVPNEAMWDDDFKPQLDRVIFVPREDTDTEITALLSDTDDVSVIYPQPSPGIEDRLTGNVEFVVAAGGFLEGLFPNFTRPPGDSKAVREALLYAIDRPAIAEAVFGGLNPGTLDCAGWSPTIGPWCDESDFGDVTQDLDMAEQILTDDGWTRGSDGVWEKGGEDLVIEWNTVAGNARREDVQAIVQEQVSDFGIRFNIQNFEAGELFQNRLPALNYGMFLAAQVTTPDPDMSEIYACDQIPGEENDFGGQNYSGYCNEELDVLLGESNRTSDVDARVDLIQQVGDVIRDDVVWIPLYPLPNLVAWRTDIVAGPVGDFVSSPLGGFANMYDWSVA